MHRIAFAILALLCYLPAVAAPPKPKLAEQYKRWLDQDVVYIITDEERKGFLALTTDEQREKFIEDFWQVRNPKHGSDTNPFKDAHYARLDYANSHFGRDSNTPGWMTDMGRAYILFGAPTSRHPFVGYGQIYPMELWFYQNSSNSPALPAFYYLLFYINGDIGEYKFYRPFMDGPMKLVRGTQFNSNRDVYKFLQPLGGDVAHAAFSLVPSEPIDMQNFQPDMSSDMLIGKIQNYANNPFNVQRIRTMRSLREKVTSTFRVDANRPIEVTSLVLTDPAGKYWLDYGVLIDDPKLGQPDGAQLKLNITYRLTTEAGETILEDSEERAYTAFQDAPAGAKQFAPFIVSNRLPIEPGAYKLTVDITNQQAKQDFKGEVDVSAGPAKQASFAGPLITTLVDRVAHPSPLQPFQYFGVQFHPAARREVHHPDPLRLLFELHQPPGSTANYQLEYIVAQVQDKDARRSITDDVAQSEFKDGRLLKSKSIAISDLENGDYRLIVNLRQAGSNEVIASSNTPLRIAADKGELPLYVLAGAQALARPGLVAYMRALEAIAQKNDPAATEYFRLAVEQNPANVFAGQYLVQLYFTQKKYTPIAELYKKLGIAAFKASPVTLAQIAVSFRQSGDAAQAKGVISEGLGFFPGDAMLSALQKRVN